MKKIAILFLLSIFLFNTVGYFIAFKSVQYEIKSEVLSEIKQDINNKELTPVTINKNNLQDIEWLESGEEMRYNDQLYDIVKSTETSSTITYYCIADTKEESLFTNLDEHIRTHIAANKPAQNQKTSVDKVIKLYFAIEQSIKFKDVSLNRVQFLQTNLIYSSTLLETDSPPPEFV